MKSKDKPSSAAELRRLAQKRVQEQQMAATRPGTEQDTLRLLHELQVHQIELKMQNEELMAARAEIEAGLEQYTDLYDFAPVGYFTLDSDWTICQANITGANLLGVPRSMLVRRRLGHFVASGDSGRWDQYLSNVMQSDEKHACELTFKRADGTTFHSRVESIRTDRPAQKTPGDDSSPVTRVAMTDISDRKREEEALRQSERLYRAIGESIDYGIWVCDAGGRNTYASGSFLKMVGITQEQCSGMGWGDLLHPDDIESTMAAWTQCVERGGPWYREHRFRGADGQWHPVLACGVAVRNERSEVTAWAGINLDISQLKSTEAALQTSVQEKDVLLKEIHHRVKNNMQVISSLVGLQADSLENQALRWQFDDLRDQIHTMALVHEKLYQSENLAEIDFGEYSRSLLGYLWRAYGEKAAHVKLILDVQSVTLSVQTAVPCGLILNELVTNALKHAFRSRPDSELTVTMHNEPNGNMCLRVRDNGVGFPSGFDWRHTRSLGLQLVQMLASQLAGTVEMRQDGGTEFLITFKQAKQ